MASQKIRYPENQIAASPTGPESFDTCRCAIHTAPSAPTLLACRLEGDGDETTRSGARGGRFYLGLGGVRAAARQVARGDTRRRSNARLADLAAAHPPSVPAGATAGGARPSVRRRAGLSKLRRSRVT